MKVKSKISSAILRVLLWKTKDIDKYINIDKAVLVMAPHTSFLDFIVGKLVLVKYDITCCFFIKQEIFKGHLFKKFLLGLGGIPINRSCGNNHVEEAVDKLKATEKMWIIITPEGTRSKVERWKRGFYYIANEAKVPVLISYLDYKKREAAIVEEFKPTGNYSADIIYIKSKYKGITGRHPENQ